LRPLRQKRRPGRIRGVAGCGNLQFVAATDVDRVKRGPLPDIAEKHQHASVRRECRSLVVESLREEALARAVGLENADREITAGLSRKRVMIAAWRQARRRVMSPAEVDSGCRSAARWHDVDLLRAAAVALEADATSIGRIT